MNIKSPQAQKIPKASISSAHLLLSALGASTGKISRPSLIQALCKATKTLSGKGVDVLVGFKKIPGLGLFSEDLETELNFRLASGLVEEKNNDLIIRARNHKYFKRTAKELDKRANIDTFNELKYLLPR